MFTQTFQPSLIINYADQKIVRLLAKSQAGHLPCRDEAYKPSEVSAEDSLSFACV